MAEKKTELTLHDRLAKKSQQIAYMKNLCKNFVPTPFESMDIDDIRKFASQQATAAQQTIRLRGRNKNVRQMDLEEVNCYSKAIASAITGFCGMNSEHREAMRLQEKEHRREAQQRLEELLGLKKKVITRII